MNGQTALNAYAKTQVHSSVIDASPHKLIALLLESAQSRLVSAKLAVDQGDIAKRGELTGKIIDILSNLQADLDLEKGGAIAANLDALYDYMVRRVVEANRTGSKAILDEVHGLLSEIKAGWDGIAQQVSA